MKKLTLRMQISIQSETQYGGGLNLTEEMQFPEKNFFEIAQILGKFHELAERIKTTGAQ